jgi:hypothetical protein
VPSSGLTRSPGRGDGSSAHDAGLGQTRRHSRTLATTGDLARKLLPPSASGADRTCTAGTYRPTLAVRRTSGTAFHPENQATYVLIQGFQIARI